MQQSVGEDVAPCTTQAVDRQAYQQAFSLGNLFKENNRPYALEELRAYDSRYCLSTATFTRST